jgi:hypothetical protein
MAYQKELSEAAAMGRKGGQAKVSKFLAKKKEVRR